MVREEVAEAEVEVPKQALPVQAKAPAVEDPNHQALPTPARPRPVVVLPPQAVVTEVDTPKPAATVQIQVSTADKQAVLRSYKALRSLRRREVADISHLGEYGLSVPSMISQSTAVSPVWRA